MPAPSERALDAGFRHGEPCNGLLLGPPRPLELSPAPLEVGLRRRRLARDLVVLGSDLLRRSEPVDEIAQARRAQEDVERRRLVGGVEHDEPALEPHLRPP